MSKEKKQSPSPGVNLTSTTTYQSGLTQATAFRVIKKYTDTVLAEYKLTSMQWFTIGTVLDSKKSGIRISDLARKLGTTLAYMTNIVNVLESRKIVSRFADRDDARNKYIVIRPEYLHECQGIEKHLRTRLRELLYKEIKPEELAVYVAVLYKITSLDTGKKGS